MPMNRAVREVSEGGEGNIKKIVLVFPSSSEPDELLLAKKLLFLDRVAVLYPVLYTKLKKKSEE